MDAAREELATAASMAKYHAGETAVKVSDNALQVFGG
ncbi:acyl-CoA dehydrogenase family protein [Spirillospora sp. NPDC048911]